MAWSIFKTNLTLLQSSCCNVYPNTISELFRPSMCVCHKFYNSGTECTKIKFICYQFFLYLLFTQEFFTYSIIQLLYLMGDLISQDQSFILSSKCFIIHCSINLVFDHLGSTLSRGLNPPGFHFSICRISI